ncbi:unnamed protein product, partial [Amoebophrya sp. A25]|eukprot:GSA25T00018419001.1
MDHLFFKVFALFLLSLYLNQRLGTLLALVRYQASLERMFSFVNYGLSLHWYHYQQTRMEHNSPEGLT